jgi:hypothetical protein
MLGDQEAVVSAIRPFLLHDVPYFDLALTFSDGRTASARLGQESVPADLQPGDRVVATMAANMVVSVRRT